MEKEIDINNPKDFAYHICDKQVNILSQLQNEYRRKHGELDGGFFLEDKDKKIDNALIEVFKSDCERYGIKSEEQKQEIIDNTLYYICTDKQCEPLIDFFVNKLGGNLNKKNKKTGKSPLDVAAELVAVNGLGDDRLLGYIINYLDNTEKDSNFDNYKTVNNRDCLLI